MNIIVATEVNVKCIECGEDVVAKVQYQGNETNIFVTPCPCCKEDDNESC